MNISLLTLAELGRSIRAGGVSPVRLVEDFYERIAKINPSLNAYILLMKDEALEEAEEREKELKEGKNRGPLHGIPLSLKDNIATKGARTTAGSKHLANWIPDYDAAVVEKLKEQGAIILGKTNMHEWAKGSSNINPFYGATRNPWDTRMISGGSSGGSASAVSASLCLGSLGTDNAGSVRMPASLCGVVGLKPTFGRIPHHGVVDGTGSWSLDTVGVLAKTPEDAALLLKELAAPDPRDRPSLHQPPFASIDLDADLGEVSIGVVREYFFDVSAKEVREGVDQAAAVFGRLGMGVQEVKIPHIRHAPAAWATISRAEAWSCHEERVKSEPEGYSLPILRRLLMGRFIDSSQYLRAQRARSILIQEFDDALRKVDYLITPATPIPACTIEEFNSGFHNIDGKKVDVGGICSVLARCTAPFSLTGHPAVSIPCGFTPEGLPLGLQIVGKAFDEARLLAVAQRYEKATGFLKRQPPL